MSDELETPSARRGRNIQKAERLCEWSGSAFDQSVQALEAIGARQIREDLVLGQTIPLRSLFEQVTQTSHELADKSIAFSGAQHAVEQQEIVDPLRRRLDALRSQFERYLLQLSQWCVWNDDVQTAIQDVRWFVELSVDDQMQWATIAQRDVGEIEGIGTVPEEMWLPRPRDDADDFVGCGGNLCGV